MLVKDIKTIYPLVYKALLIIAESDGTGLIDIFCELPDTYKNISMKEFLKNFNKWLIQFDNKSTEDIICPKDFKDYLGWDDNTWDFYNEHKEWDNMYSQEIAMTSFVSSESSVIEVIEVKYHGEIYSDFLVDCFNGDIPIFSWSVL